MHKRHVKDIIQSSSSCLLSIFRWLCVLFFSRIMRVCFSLLSCVIYLLIIIQSNNIIRLLCLSIVSFSTFAYSVSHESRFRDWPTRGAPNRRVLWLRVCRRGVCVFIRVERLKLSPRPENISRLLFNSCYSSKYTNRVFFDEERCINVRHIYIYIYFTENGSNNATIKCNH